MTLCVMKLCNFCFLRRSKMLAGCIQELSSHSKPVEDKLKIDVKPPCSNTYDWIGPPDPISNIRPVKFGEHPDETPTERSFRLRWAETLQWNQEFWHRHNTKFFKEKEDFVKRIEQSKGEGENTVSAEELSKFYRTFLDENRKVHLNYNREWYQKNISLLWPALKVAFIRGLRRMKKTASRS